MIFLSYEKKMKEKFIQLLRKTNREGIEDLINFIEESGSKSSTDINVIIASENDKEITIKRFIFLYLKNIYTYYENSNRIF